MQPQLVHSPPITLLLDQRDTTAGREERVEGDLAAGAGADDHRVVVSHGTPFMDVARLTDTVEGPALGLRVSFHTHSRRS